jgi:uracil phosphoribosyltransferase
MADPGPQSAFRPSIGPGAPKHPGSFELAFLLLALWVILYTMNKIILKAEDLDGFLTEKDKSSLAKMELLYREALACFNILETTRLKSEREREEETLIRLYNGMGSLMQEICKDETGIQVYSFLTPQESHSEASRLIAKLRDVRTENVEFVYYIQRAYEMLFKLAYGGAPASNKNYMVVKTPVNVPVQNFAIHKINNVDEKIENTVMCVMLRGALLPSMILSKEIEEYSSHGYVTPFALFKISRDDTKHENNMEYILDLDRSYFNLESLHGKDLIFADPMNATGGSLVTVIKYLLGEGVKPRSVRFFNAIAALKGALRVVRALDNCTVYTLWMDPVLNELAYIMPGLGDAGDRLNGRDTEEHSRNIIQLIADYGSTIAQLYRAQLREIEDTVLGTGKK